MLIIFLKNYNTTQISGKYILHKWRVYCQKRYLLDKKLLSGFLISEKNVKLVYTIKKALIECQ